MMVNISVIKLYSGRHLYLKIKKMKFRILQCKKATLEDITLFFVVQNNLLYYLAIGYLSFNGSRGV